MRSHDLTSPSRPFLIANYEATARRMGLYRPATADADVKAMPHIVDVDCPAESNLKRPSRFRREFLERVRWCQQYGVGGWAVEPIVGRGRVSAYRFRFANVHIATLFRVRFEVDLPQRSEKQG